MKGSDLNTDWYTHRVKEAINPNNINRNSGSMDSYDQETLQQRAVRQPIAEGMFR